MKEIRHGVEQIEYVQRVYTRDIVRFLISQSDQVSTTKEMAEKFNVSQTCVRQALERLRKVGRVDEISPNMWHLE